MKYPIINLFCIAVGGTLLGIAIDTNMGCYGIPGFAILSWGIFVWE